jgi:phosphoribosyl 1,2-cyclic phosphodiesterase
VNIRFWGTRGSVPTAGPQTQRYGGNTSCVELRAADSAVAVLDAGTGICMLGATLPFDIERVDVLLSHLHMDHILGLGFFAGLFRPDIEVHVWGPGSTTQPLSARLTRYLSPPLFPVRLRDLPCRFELHDVPLGTFEIPGLAVTTALVCHPGPTIGYRLEDGRSTLAYISDHEPALGARTFPEPSRWTSGFALADGVDVLVHDAQYTDDEYSSHVGWGHSAVGHATAFAAHTGVRRLIAFHHDPWHNDEALDSIYRALESEVPVTAAQEGMTLDVAVGTADHDGLSGQAGLSHR